MLEYGFNELDNDYITVWSRYLLTMDFDYVKKDIERLAEAGQINAIQKWYSFQGLNYNTKIDKLVTDLVPVNYNTMLAKGLFTLLENNDKYQKLQKEYEDLQLEYKKIEDTPTAYSVRGVIYYSDEQIEVMEHIESKMKDVASSAKQLFLHIIKSLNSVNEAIDINNNTIAREFRDELLLYVDKHLILSAVDEEQIAIMLKKSHRKTLKTLLKEYKKNRNLVKENPSTAFALAKSLVIFEKNEKIKQLGVNILTELSQRELTANVNNSVDVATDDIKEGTK